MPSPLHQPILLIRNATPEYGIRVEFADQPHRQDKQTTESQITLEPINTTANTAGDGALIMLAVLAAAGLYGTIVDQRDKRK